MSPTGPRPDDAAIVGLGAVFPGAADVPAFWRNIAAGVDAITDVPPDRWDPAVYWEPDAGRATRGDRLYCRRGGFVDDLATFDPVAFGIMPAAMDGIEPDQLLALRAATEAITDAGGESRLPDRSRIGVIFGRGGYMGAATARLDQQVRTAHQVAAVLRDVAPDLGEERLAAIRTAFQDAVGPQRAEAVIGLVPSFTASRIANRLDLGGPAYTVDAACATSLVALDQAVGELASRRCDAVILGSVHHVHLATLWSVFTQLRALSPSMVIRPFDRAADGTLISEGTAALLLKRLADAERDGDRVYAVVRGVGVGGDGRAASLMSPAVDGQVRALERAWRAADLDPTRAASVGLVEAHGTGTPVGDEVELTTLGSVFGPSGTPGPRIGLGSVKSMIGHTMQASGAAGLLKAVLALRHRTLPPTLHVDDPHPALAATRMRIVGEAEPWEAARRDGRVVPRRVGVNAFGFGGVNAHAVVEEAPEGAGVALPVGAGVATRMRGGAESAGGGAASDAGVAESAAVAEGAGAAQTGDGTGGAAVAEPGGTTEATTSSAASLAYMSPVVSGASARSALSVTSPESAAESLLMLAGPTPADLTAQLEHLRDHGPEAAAPGVVTGPAPHTGPCRLALVGAPAPDRVALALRVVARGLPWRGRGDVWFTPRPLLGPYAATPGRVALLFPGLEPEMQPRSGDVADLFGLPRPAPPGGSEVVDRAKDTLGTGRLLAAALERIGVRPDLVAGHSVGEWTGMVVAGMYPPETIDSFLASLRPDALELPDLVYAAVSLGAADVGPLIAGVPGRVVVSHENCPHQCVVCGPHDAVAALVGRLRASGTLCQELPFRSGFHTPMWEPYLGQVREAFDRLPLRRPELPVWSATSVAAYPDDAAAVRSLTIRHLLEPVRFADLTRRLHDAGVRAFVQAGAGSLTGFVDDTLRGDEALCVPAQSARHPGVAGLRRAAAALWAEGLPIDPTALRPGRGRADAGAAPGSSRAGRRGADVADAPGPSRAGQGRADAAAAPSPSRADAAPARATRGTRPAVRLNLGSPIVRLPETARTVPARGLAPVGLSADPSGTGLPVVGLPVAGLPVAADSSGAGHHPLAVALTSALNECAAATAGVVGRWNSKTASQQGSSAPAPSAVTTAPAPGGGAVAGRSANRTETPGSSGPATSSPVSPTAAPTPATRVGGHPIANTGQDQPRSPTTSPGSAPAPRDEHRSPREFSLRLLPYVRDHCIYEQPDLWPDDADRFPVVPMATLLHLASDAARTFVPGAVVLGYEDVRAMRWLPVAPPTVTDVVTRRLDRDRVLVEFAGFASTVVVLGAKHTAPPTADPAPLTGEVPAPVSATALYRDRWMFHGPRFAGVEDVVAVADDGIRGVIRVLPAPGALIDAASQVFGHWMQLRLDVNRLVFPMSVRTVHLYGPQPPTGTRLFVTARIRQVTATTVRGDVEVAFAPDGPVWARAEGWTYRRFAADERVWPMKFTPHTAAIGEHMPDGDWCLARVRWPDTASREMTVRRYLGGTEHAAYDALPDAARSDHVLGRIAVKDAVRHHLWRLGAGPIYPAEVTVGQEPSGRPVVVVSDPAHGPAPHVSLAHSHRLGVGIARPWPVGIDVERIGSPEDDGAALEQAAFGADERELVDSLAESADRAEGRLRLWCAKEAAGKADGTGLAGRPRDRRVTLAPDEPAQGERLLVTGPDGAVREVATRIVDDAPPGGGTDRYVVAWTVGPAREHPVPGD